MSRSGWALLALSLLLPAAVTAPLARSPLLRTSNEHIVLPSVQKEDLLAAAVNDAVRKVEKTSQDKMSGLTAGLNIPGLNLPV